MRLCATLALTKALEEWILKKVAFLPPVYRKLVVLVLGGVFFHTFTRLTFLVWNWKEYSNFRVLDIGTAFLEGLRFDLSATATFLVPAVLLALILKPVISTRALNILIFISFFIFLIPALALNFIDIEMINFVGRRFSWSTLFIFREVGGKGAGYFKDYGGIIIFVLLVLGLVAWLMKYWIFTGSEKGREGKPSLKKHYGWGFLFVIGMVISVRGGLQLKPLSFTHAQIFASSWLNNLVMNSSFSVIKSAKQEPLPKWHFFENENECLSFLNGSFPGPSLIDGLRPKGPQNVVIIILESFSLEYMGKINGDQGYTPFLDSLAEKSLFFSRAVANGRRSIEGVPAVLTGIPTLMEEPFITSAFAGDKIVKLPEILKSKGYHTSFFHGGQNGTMYFDSFTQGLGIQNYFGAREYPNGEDHDGTWGIYDGPFFQFFAEKLTSFPQPFFSAIFSLSSHQPYKIPDQYQKQFPEGPLPILKAITYADDSLRKFFEKAAQQSWYHNTLFVLTADHTQMSYRKDFKNDISRYRIPILFFHPEQKWPVLDQQQIVQQIDIPASILDYLGIQTPEINPLAQSVFVPGDKAATVDLDGKYFLIAKDYFLQWTPGKPEEMFTAEDVFQAHPLEEPSQRKIILLNKLKAAVEFHNNGLLENRLLVKPTR